jgi:hypothetical protein
LLLAALIHRRGPANPSNKLLNAGDNPPEATKRFIDWYITPGEKRPAAPSVRRGTSAPL